MPELPEVETVCRGLTRCMQGRRLARVEQRRPDLRFPLPPDFATRLTGRRVERIARRAKFILMHLDDGMVLICHLGMSGRMLVSDGAPAVTLPHDHIIFETDDGAVVRFNDARRFGFMDLTPETDLGAHPMLANLGPEPLGNAFNGPVLAAALKGKATPIKAALLDQRVVAGLGNIYVSESLFWAGLSPRRLAHTVQGERAERLAAAIRRVLTEAIAAGGSSLRDYVQTSGELGYFQHRWAVYDRAGEPCPGCDCVNGAVAPGVAPGAVSGIRRIVQSGRATFYCARRQR
ncbi:bifunctional DNA-formamidopyrimidine glycosylase/DNA-(apurinic or apyrimidinic site) lyase [Rhodospirillaceae bacterium SYSU D60014]|uniref:bifunctional DNA-formamidopyrimidine glycosylase/DNA-(apurinic or apyrimidinic site) lyase n=1 Tax=Virgifigura deserti TaxID=2268457 RepID=UPI000E6654EF